MIAYGNKDRAQAGRGDRRAATRRRRDGGEMRGKRMAPSDVHTRKGNTMAQRPPTHRAHELAARAEAAPTGTWRKQEGGGARSLHACAARRGPADAHLYAPRRRGSRGHPPARRRARRHAAAGGRGAAAARGGRDAAVREGPARGHGSHRRPRAAPSRRGGAGDRRRRRRARPRRAVPRRPEGDEGRGHRSAGRLVRAGGAGAPPRRQGGRARAAHRHGLCREPRVRWTTSGRRARCAGARRRRRRRRRSSGVS